MDGIILIDKEAGMTSRDVVNKVGYVLKTKHIGHTGTLDPMATGVLALCVGKATKISELITSYDKEYIAEVTLGIETDTLDIEGNILKEVMDVKVTNEQINSVLKNFVGKSEQQVPKYSAIKIDGRKLYEYARKNIEVNLPTREIEIYEISMVDLPKKEDNVVKFVIKCHVSKGTYIRSLIRDIGIELGYPACMSSLRRIKQGAFSINDCYTTKNIEEGKYSMLSISDVLCNLKQMVVDGELERKIKNGAIIDKKLNADMVKIVNTSGELLAIYKTYEEDKMKAKPYKMLI